MDIEHSPEAASLCSHIGLVSSCSLIDLSCWLGLAQGQLESYCSSPKTWPTLFKGLFAPLHAQPFLSIIPTFSKYLNIEHSEKSSYYLVYILFFFPLLSSQPGQQQGSTKKVSDITYIPNPLMYK